MKNESLMAQLFIGGAIAILTITAFTPARSHAQEPAIGTSAGPDVPFEGCFYYEHESFNGRRREIPVGLKRKYVGDEWNDKISSVACSSGCALSVWEHRDFVGARRTFAGAIQYVGDEWNDRISSVEPVCGDGITTHPVQFRSGAGKCLDVHAPDQHNNGARVQVWDCNGTIQQTWAFAGRAIKSGAGKCLDVHAPDQRNNGAKVQVWDCNGSPQQTWDWDGRRRVLRSGAGKCLDVHAPDQHNNGAKVQVWDCNGSVQQIWDVKGL